MSSPIFHRLRLAFASWQRTYFPRWHGRLFSVEHLNTFDTSNVRWGFVSREAVNHFQVQIKQRALRLHGTQNVDGDGDGTAGESLKDSRAELERLLLLERYGFDGDEFLQGAKLAYKKISELFVLLGSDSGARRREARERLRALTAPSVRFFLQDVVETGREFGVKPLLEVEEIQALLLSVRIERGSGECEEADGFGALRCFRGVSPGFPFSVWLHGPGGSLAAPTRSERDGEARGSDSSQGRAAPSSAWLAAFARFLGGVSRMSRREAGYHFTSGLLGPEGSLLRDKDNPGAVPSRLVCDVELRVREKFSFVPTEESETSRHSAVKMESSDMMIPIPIHPREGVKKERGDRESRRNAGDEERDAEKLAVPERWVWTFECGVREGGSLPSVDVLTTDGEEGRATQGRRWKEETNLRLDESAAGDECLKEGGREGGRSRSEGSSSLSEKEKADADWVGRREVGGGRQSVGILEKSEGEEEKLEETPKTGSAGRGRGRMRPESMGPRGSATTPWRLRNINGGP
uniref:Uncharacterized protein n=1 Tax=Chromera velia CCMP2878 TaxID=1169474 RepID=A0A0G4HFU0_9ALVE|eukprot:Cvel_27011.t1-p1 / transcript=Cvel_27011.t1 / gene=Cvel_27011 / organism=Chromera_velia_CCMP2878 / gene_product=hypothetical protein / transcript_product=hypothetical protein / location=Cvel_scaffold3303:548-4831(-) / protein_length=520 / sequence_SO=supercontig / SO=protein_coding / is_pseudo=false